MSDYPCMKDLYKAFLQASSVRYSGLALSEVSPSRVSHDSVSRWLKGRCFRPKGLWQFVGPSIDREAPCLLIADDTVLAKKRSKKIHLRGYGWVTVFKFVAKHGRIDYVATNKEKPPRGQISAVTAARWSVEVYHREIKQTCGIERCQARTGRAQRNHIFLAIVAWFEQHKRRLSEKITLYQQHWAVIKNAITAHIRALLPAPG
jgi:Transposase DDE domain